MPLEETIQERLDRIDKVPDRLITKTIESERQILRNITDLMADLDTKDNQILTNEKNLAKIEEISSRLRTAISGGADLPPSIYMQAVKKFSNEFQVQASLQDDYFKQTLKNYGKKEVYDQTMRNAQRRAIQKLDIASVNKQLINPVKGMLNTAVTEGMTMPEATRNINNVVSGAPGKDGALTGHVKQIAHDSFSTADREYSKVVADDNGIQFFRYLGGRIADTRPFCMQRNGKYYHRKEIRQWGALSNWKGRHRNTSPSTIFTLLGGYNCRHSLVAVPTSAVPNSVISRVEAKGFLE